MSRLRRWWPPHWSVTVQVVAGLAGVAVTLAAVDVARSGVQRPWIAAVGIVATVFVNQVYVVVSRRGRVIEGFDIAEAPAVALALLLPPGEAVLAFVIASIALELRFARARVKKVFNVGVRAIGAAVLVVPVSVLGRSARPHVGDVAAVVGGAAGYSIVTAFAIALVIASVQKQSVHAVLRADLAARVAVWSMSVAAGIVAAYVALWEPIALLGIAAPLALVFLTAQAAERATREANRLRCLLDATARVQAATSPDELEQVLVDVAGELLLWKDVEIRASAPGADEHGQEVFARGDTKRWLVASRQPGSDPWLADDDYVIGFLTRAAGVAFERTAMHEELTRQAMNDPLTGVANRRQFDKEIQRLAGTRRDYGVVLCDLDHFKTVNDRFGHDAGDELLRIAAARLNACVRTTDLVARLGGDEFVVLLPGVTTRAALQRVSESISAKFQQRVKVGRWQLSSIPCSLGVAASPRDGRTPREVLRAADESMYDAKKTARKASRPKVTVSLPEQATVDLPAEEQARVIKLGQLRAVPDVESPTGTTDPTPSPKA